MAACLVGQLALLVRGASTIARILCDAAHMHATVSLRHQPPTCLVALSTHHLSAVDVDVPMVDSKRVWGCILDDRNMSITIACLSFLFILSIGVASTVMVPPLSTQPTPLNLNSTWESTFSRLTRTWRVTNTCIVHTGEVIALRDGSSMCSIRTLSLYSTSRCPA